MDHADTHERIIQAAIEVFLEKGYDQATVRDICAKAGANVAAVNYHFGSKDGLHAAVLETIMGAHHQAYPMEEGMAEAASPEERLRVFIRNIMRLNYPNDPEHARQGRLFWMELANPSPALTPMVERFIRPIKDTLEEIISGIIGPTAPETLRLCAGSVAAPTFFHAQNPVFITHLYPEKTCTPEDVAQLTDHIYLFCLAGLIAVRDSLAREGRS